MWQAPLLTEQLAAATLPHVETLMVKLQVLTQQLMPTVVLASELAVVHQQVLV